MKKPKKVIFTVHSQAMTEGTCNGCSVSAVCSVYKSMNSLQRTINNPVEVKFECDYYKKERV